jgi:hypothetical protein
MSEELRSAAKRGDVGVVRAILDRGNVNINRGDEVTILFFYLFYFILFILFISLDGLLFIGLVRMVIPVW